MCMYKSSKYDDEKWEIGENTGHLSKLSLSCSLVNDNLKGALPQKTGKQSINEMEGVQHRFPLSFSVIIIIILLSPTYIL